MNWTQVSCGPCWRIQRPDIPEPVRVIPPRGLAEPFLSSVRCSWCDQPTNSGIYFRAHPDTVPFPQPEDDED